MAKNIEIKAQIKNLTKLLTLAKKISDSGEIIINQKDIFYNAPKGRLKLRIFSPQKGELIYYERNNMKGPKESNYFITTINNPSTLNDTLSLALGVKGVVQKQRRLFLIGQTRLHIDDVEKLGQYMELEVVLQEDQTNEEGEYIAKDLIKKLQISDKDLIDKAYIDLINEKIKA